MRRHEKEGFFPIEIGRAINRSIDAAFPTVRSALVDDRQPDEWDIMQLGQIPLLYEILMRFPGSSASRAAADRMGQLRATDPNIAERWADAAAAVRRATENEGVCLPLTAFELAWGR